MNSRSRFTLMAAAAACLVLITTGCSKSSAGPSVAALATPSAVASSGDGSSPVSGSPAPTGAAGLLAYSECMRSHGVLDFPDPVGNTLQLKASQGSDLDPNSPQMQAAQKACQSLQPGGGNGGTTSPAQEAAALKYSACMRSNGVPNFPDPVFSGGGMQLKITNIDPNSPQFVAAQKACQSLEPGRGGGGGGIGQAGQGAAGGGGQTDNSGP